MLIVTAEQMRALDRRTIELGTPGWTLMRRAGQGATRALLAAFPRLARRRVVVVCGKGNNGGDGFVIAHELKKKGIAVDVFLAGGESQVKGDAALALQAWRRGRGKVRGLRSADDVGVLQERLEGAACIVDALFGTGLKGEVKGVAADIIALLNASGVPIFAVDIPSGLDSDLGTPLGSAIQAEATATFAFAKIGQVVHPGVQHCGHLTIVDIGIAPEAVDDVTPQAVLLDEGEVSPLVPRREPTAHKGDAGHVVIIAGSRGKTGAAILASRAAARGGAGLVTAAVAESQQAIVAAGLLEAMSEILPDEGGHLGFDEMRLREVLRGKAAVVCGPGLGTGDGAQVTVEWLLAQRSIPMVLDADGLNLFAALLREGDVERADAPLVLTPHPGEMSRLSGRSTAEIQADRVTAARNFATSQGCVLVLKGARTVVAAPDGRIAINPTGNPGMASGGMGDVLAGLIGALLAQRLDAFDAACLGVHLHGHAADLIAAEQGMIGLLAGDVAEALPHALQSLG